MWHSCFPVNSEKFLRIPFLQNASGRLLLNNDPEYSGQLSRKISFIQQKSINHQANILDKFMLCSRKTKQCYYFENNGIYTLRKNFGDSLFQVHHFEFIALRMFHVRERSRLIEIQFFFMKLNLPQLFEQNLKSQLLLCLTWCTPCF